MSKKKPAFSFKPWHLPEVLIVTSDGRLLRKDGGSVKAYLREWHKNVSNRASPEAIPVNILHHQLALQTVIPHCA